MSASLAPACAKLFHDELRHQTFAAAEAWQGHHLHHERQALRRDRANSGALSSSRQPPCEARPAVFFEESAMGDFARDAFWNLRA